MSIKKTSTPAEVNTADRLLEYCDFSKSQFPTLISPKTLHLLRVLLLIPCVILWVLSLWKDGVVSQIVHLTEWGNILTIISITLTL